ncbi:MAG TPA: outer membrane beta-barrel protein [Verrucomicrobiae bacterium]|nr:outer membrane beta-barrel protein [Verrucomicrobiae bacterium]
MKSIIRKTRVAHVCGTLLVASALPAWAQGPSTGYYATVGSSAFYVNGGVGPSLAEDTEVQEFFGPVSGSEVKYDTGVRFSVGGGYQINEWLGAGFETGLIWNSAKSVTGSPDADFTVGHVPFLANVVFQCPRTAPVIPFIGLGAGFAGSTIDIESFTLGGTTVTGTETDVVYALQAFAGMRYEFTEQLSAGVTYKYFRAGEPEWEESDFSLSGQIKFGRTETHSLLVTFNYRF